MKKRILIIEKNKRIAIPLVEQINWDPNLSAVHCGSIDDAINESKKPFDMVIIDPIISGMNLLTENEIHEIDGNPLFKGFVLLRRLKTINPKVKIILYTTLSNEGVGLWKKTFDSHLCKPQLFKIIKSEIDKLLDFN